MRGLFTHLYDLDAFPNTAQAYALPAKYEELYAYDTLVLSNLDFATSSYAARRMLKDYVEDGGRLVLLGGNRALGEGGLKGTYLEAICPFELKGTGEVVRCEPPLLLGGKPGAPHPDNMALFWRHDVTLKPDAFTIAYAGAHPIAARVARGKGLAVAFAGTVLGEGTANVTPFWETGAWAGLVKTLVLE